VLAIGVVGVARMGNGVLVVADGAEVYELIDVLSEVGEVGSLNF